ncbi:DUF5675 family protein [Nonlabens xiamenensis]|uniref:DUF5675 family protein n=1 Tax=Nonlabens xiamenensis TaxID=2341043 RepID=UPI000F605A60|nr:DUF5675 family protein [Nonlabens xiamenensis]
MQHYLHLLDIPNRSLILIHTANDAVKELQGCIALVSSPTGIGKGLQSRAALNKLLAICHEAFESSEKVDIHIKIYKLLIL